jgi:hypothetical protein
VIGKWIDGLTDAQRDRIVQHPDPTYDGREWWDLERDCGCLVGCVVGQSGEWSVGRFFGAEWLIPNAVLTHPSLASTQFGFAETRIVYQAGIRFPRLVTRFGAPRIWRAVKARAAVRNRVSLPLPAEVG